MAIHPLLLKQITKHLGPQALDNPEFASIINIVSASYESYERDKKITEHAFQVSEKEYQDVLNNLKKEIDLRKESIEKVKLALTSLDKDSESKWSDSDDLMGIIDFLNAQISIKNELEHTLLLAKENAEKAAKAKSDFLSVMSHEIRTPLNAIIGNIHILKQERHLPEQNEFITTLEISSHNLLNLINDILDFSKIEDGKVKFDKKSFSLKNLLSDIKSTNRFRADEHQNAINLNYSPELPEYVVGDSLRLGQILNNLVSNAIKFTSKGTIDINVSQVKYSPSHVQVKFEVRDSGIGIEKDNITKVFERFTQANSNITRVHGGSGLGLAIVKKLLVLMNSDIYVDSTFGVGSVFYFTLEFQTSSQTENLPTKNAEAENETLIGVNLLLVEDVKFNIIVAKKMMESWKVNIDLAENGKEAVDKVQQKNFDVILMDLQMPIMDGITATKRIRELGIKTPIIALTASVSNDTQTEVFSSGMDDYLTKPFNPKDLFGAIKKATNRS
jgi:signal transduction histidine kinase/CheY-like chemotaxis protein